MDNIPVRDDLKPTPKVDTKAMLKAELKKRADDMKAYEAEQ